MLEIVDAIPTKSESLIDAAGFRPKTSFEVFVESIDFDDVIRQSCAIQRPLVVIMRLFMSRTTERLKRQEREALATELAVPEYCP